MPGYYYSTDGVNTVGPIDINGLAALLRSRTITRQTPAIIEGHSEWLTVGDYLPNTLRSPRLNPDEDLDDDEALGGGAKKPSKPTTRPLFAFLGCLFFGPFCLLLLNWKLAILALIGGAIVSGAMDKHDFFGAVWIISICLGTLWSILARRK